MPPKDPTPDYNLIQANEENGFTNVQFDRIPTTEGDDKDVQFGVRLDNTSLHSICDNIHEKLLREQFSFFKCISLSVQLNDV